MKKLFIVILCFWTLGTNSCFENPSEAKMITIGFAGDVMLGRLVNEAITQHGYDYPLGSMKEILHKNDLNIINLEFVLTNSEKKVPKVFNFKADPDKVEVLKRGNISLVNLANNHSLDFSQEGLLETIDVLEKAGISYVGAGKDLQDAKKGKIIEINGTKIGMIGYTDNEPTWLAAENKPGTNYIEVGDIENVKKDIKALRPNVDILILSIHWGPNMRQVPSKEFQNFAHALIDEGIDILHGHSAHVIQGVEVYKKKLILYDTGDFIDDYRVEKDLRNDYTFLYNVTIESGKLKSLHLIPALISNMQVNKAPSEEMDKIISLIKKLSLKFGTELIEKDQILTVDL